jgi:hypothetical protein
VHVQINATPQVVTIMAKTNNRINIYIRHLQRAVGQNRMHHPRGSRTRVVVLTGDLLHIIYYIYIILYYYIIHGVIHLGDLRGACTMRRHARGLHRRRLLRAERYGRERSRRAGGVDVAQVADDKVAVALTCGRGDEGVELEVEALALAGGEGGAGWRLDVADELGPGLDRYAVIVCVENLAEVEANWAAVENP